MSDVKPVLSYATPIGASHTVPNQTVFTFLSPPVRQQFRMFVLIMIACAVGSLAIAVIGIAQLFDRRYNDNWPWPPFAACLAVTTGMAGVASRRYRRLKRVGEPLVRLEVADGFLTIDAPQQWSPRRLPVNEIYKLKCEPLHALIASSGTTFIYVKETTFIFDTLTIRIANEDPGVLSRAVDDLNRLIEHAKSANPRE